MGGNIFQKVEKIQRKNIFSLIDKVGKPLFEKGIEYYPVKFIDEKETFGDLDILVDLYAKDQLKDLADLYECSNYSINGDVLSMNIDNHQVDLIFVHEKNAKLMQTFYNYSIIGFVVDRMLRQFNLKITPSGIYYRLDDMYGNRNHFHLTDEDIVFQLLKLNTYRYKNGFKNYEEVFEFLAESPYFSKEILLPSSMKSSSAKRALKRPVYNQLLEWLENKTFHPVKLFDLPFKYEQKIDFLTKEYYDDLSKAKELKKHFNGNIIKSLVYLPDEDMSKFISIIKSKYSHDDLCRNAKDIIFKEYKEFKIGH